MQKNSRLVITFFDVRLILRSFITFNLEYRNGMI